MEKARREFRVNWETLKQPKDLTPKEEHCMRMLRHLLDEGGFRLDHTEGDGTMVYVAESK